MERVDVYDRVTAAIIDQLEAGARPWAPNWKGAPLSIPLRSTGEAYRGVNVLLLWGTAMARGYSQRRWVTFKQALALGGNVRKGEKGSPVVYANKIIREGEGENGETVEVKIPFMRGYTVFNLEQCDGLPPELFEHPEPREDAPSPIPAAEAFFASLGADIRTQGAQPLFNGAGDFIAMPPLSAFEDAAGYYATLGHETVHWSGHKSRLARDLGGKRFGDAGYAAEELVAEIGAAFLAADLGLYCEPREDHAAYLAGWLKILKADNRAIFTAASLAQKACDYLHQLAGREAQSVAA